MTLKPLLAACATFLLATPALAQSTSGKPLNLELPPESIPAAATSAHAAPTPAHASSSTRSQASQPGVYYGDTSGRIGASDPTPSCDDASYTKPQVHGSVGVGVVAGGHASGNYQSGTMHISQAFGSCGHPTGHVSISVGVGQGQFDGHPWRH